jgi:hypothetical protein
VTGVQWLGSTLRVAAISASPLKPSTSDSGKASRTVVSIIDLVTSSTSIMMNDTWKSNPAVVLRACPTGRFLLVVPSEGATQVRSHFPQRHQLTVVWFFMHP